MSLCPETDGGKMNNNSDTSKIILKHDKANVIINLLPSGKRKITIQRLEANYFVRFDTCETAYPIELIQQIFDEKGPGWLCDEIARDESPDYTGAALKWQLLSYISEEAFINSKILDFGCGSGASSCSMSRMFPTSKIIGIELEENLLAIAKARVKFYELENVDLYHSPDPENIPKNLGEFDHIIMTGVFEHLLPKERENLLPQLWSLLKPGGILFLHETPNILFPIETHTTGRLPFINYLPKSIALPYARKFSNRNLNADSWETLLRKGIRGGKISEIINILKNTDHPPTLMNPSRLGVKNRIDLWYLSSEKNQHGTAKKIIRRLISFINSISGIELVPYLELAIQKNDSSY